MIYLVIQILNYPQLLKIDEESTLGIRENLADIITTHYDGSIIHQNDLMISRIGDERVISPAKVADCVTTLLSYLKEQEEKLYGFVLLGLMVSNGGREEDLMSLTRKSLLMVDGENAIWVDSQLKTFLKDFFTFFQIDRFWKVSEPTIISKPKEREIIEFIARPHLFNMIMNGISKRLNRGGEESGLLIKGPAGYGRRKTVEQIARQFNRSEKGLSPIRLFTIFHRQSPIHPFLNSIDSNLIDKVPNYLYDHETAIWNNASKLISYLKNQKDKGKCTDHLFEDFFIAYNIYLTAYLRMMEEKLLPTLFICEDFETFHASSIKALAGLLKDFMRNGSFLPVLITAKDEIPQELQELKLDIVEAGAVEWREIRATAASLYPGLNLPRYAAREIRRVTGGKYLPTLHYLFYLNTTGKIQAEDGKYRWLSRKERYVNFPKSAAICTVNLLKNLDPLSQDVLYTIYLSGGLLGRTELSYFLDYHGIKIEESERIIRYLSHLGFISTGDSLLPTLPALKKRIVSIMGSRSEGIQKDLLDFVIKQYHEGNYRHLILLFYFFIRNSRHRLAVKILTQIIQQKLDERDYGGVLPFLNFDQSVFKETLKNDEQQKVDLFIRSARLRFSLNNSDSEPLEEIIESPQELLTQLRPCRERGYYLLQCVNHYLRRGDVADAIEMCKLSLIDFNEYGKREDEARAYTELGSCMLASGKIEDAIEYLTLSDRILSQSSFDRLKCLGFTGIVLFLYGNLTNALKIINEGIKLAHDIGHREWQLFLSFFEGRIFFHLGDYLNAAVIFQSCLTLARLYSSFDSMRVLYAWLARSHIYLDQTTEGLRILEGIDANRESLFFVSEAFYFQERYNEALDCLNRSEKIVDRVISYPGEKVFWHDGYASIEGRCLFLESEETLLEKLSHSFKAYIIAILGDRGEAIDDLQAATRLTKLNELDFFNSLYFYFYSQILPEYGENEAVDRLTVLNKALRFLQERAGRIESADQRSIFLNKNRWNKLLMEEAKKKRLL
jgi:tetratricopeptide (TPR) repeat protein